MHMDEKNIRETDEQQSMIEGRNAVREAFRAGSTIDRLYVQEGLKDGPVMDLIRTFPFGEAKKVWLSYEPENLRAKTIYQKYGFVENGEMCGNEIVAVYEL